MRDRNSHPTNHHLRAISEVLDIVHASIKPLTCCRSWEEELCEFARIYLTNILYDTYCSLHMIYGFADFIRDVMTINRRTRNEGVYFVTKVLPDFMDNVLNVAEERKAVFTHFTVRNGLPIFLRRLTKTVTIDSCDAKTQARALHGIYNISVAFKKLRGEAPEDLLNDHFLGFLRTEKEIGVIDVNDPELEPIIRSIQTQWNCFASDINFDGDEAVPRPGPGATVDCLRKGLRYAPHSWFAQLDAVFPYDEWFYPFKDEQREKSQDFERLINASKEPYSQYLLVPKTYDKWRGICKEFNDMQFIQQMVRRVLQVHIDRKLKHHLPLKDQSVHGSLALQASIDREKSTIDESEASDRILRVMICKMTEGTPLVHDALMAVSSRKIKPPQFSGMKVPFKVHKFAPMGSAICFPVMSLFHLFLIKAIIYCHVRDVSISQRDSLLRAVSVYGDDIVLPSAIYDIVTKWLPKFGLKVNLNKSFVKSHFRESCGVHAFKGYDITPVYVKYTNFSSAVDEAKQLASLLAIENELYYRNYRSTAKFLRNHVSAKWDNLPYVGNDTALVGFKRQPGSPDLTNFRYLEKRSVRRSWDRFLQTFRYRVKVFCAHSIQSVIPTDEEAYMRYFCMKPKRDVQYRLSKTGDLITPFRMDEFVNRVDDETLLVSTRYVTMPESALYAPAEKLVIAYS